MLKAQNPPLILMILGWIVITLLPTTFFFFGWRDLDIHCLRQSTSTNPTCQVQESFAFGLYTQSFSVQDVVSIGYKTQLSKKPGSFNSPISTNHLAFITSTREEVALSKISSNVDKAAKEDLWRVTTEYLQSPSTLQLDHHAPMHSIFGYLGLMGCLGLLWVVFVTGRHYLNKMTNTRVY